VRIAPDEPPVLLEQGDLIIITRGASHTLYCDPKTEGLAVQLDTVVEQSGFTGTGALIWGEPGTDHETQLVCGHFAFDPHAHHMLLDALPSHIHIENYGESAGHWMESTLRVIGTEAGRAQPGGDLIALKMSEIIFAQALRSYLASPDANRPVISAFADPGIARALTAIHQDPAFNWTLEDLAREAGMSRTSFATRFAERMTTTPLGYITHWRMQLAQQQLVHSDAAIIDIAESVGYHSEAAFSRVFKKHHLTPPATYRRMVQQPGAETASQA
jgi:AraC-like DNA-binding protein